MKYIKRHTNHTAYQDYLSSDDIWLPRVSFIINGGETPASDDKYDDEGPSYLDFARLGTEFIQIANNGTMYFTDQVIDNVAYTANVSGDALEIKTIDLTTGQFTNNAYVDDANGQIVVNYPGGTTQTIAL